MGRMPRPRSDKLTTELLDRFLTYNPTTGELRTRATGKLLDPLRPTKIGGVSISPARAAFAMGNLYLHDKITFYNGDPSDLRLSNLVKNNVHFRREPEAPRKEWTRRPRVKAPEPPATWTERLDSPAAPVLQPNLAYATFLRRHFSYDPTTGAMVNIATGFPIKAVGKNGVLRTIRLPKPGFEENPPQAVRADRLAWLLATTRLPDKETTMVLPGHGLTAASIFWHPEGIPRAEPKPLAKQSSGRWLPYVYYNGKTTRVEGSYSIEEEALAAADAHALTLKSRWQGGLVSLATYMQQLRDEPAPTPTLPKPEPLKIRVSPWSPPDWDDDEGDDIPVGPSLMSITGEMRKPWSYTPIVVDLD